MRRTRVLIIVIVVAALLFSAMSIVLMKLSTEKATAEKAIDYIEEKYGEDFTLLAEDPDSFVRSGILTCYTGGMNPHDDEFVTITIEGKISPKFHDNYFGYLIRDEVEQTFTDIVGEEFPENKVFCTVESKSPFPDQLRKGDTYEDFMALGTDININLMVFVNENPEYSQEQYETSMGNIEQSIAELGQRCGIQIHAVDSEHYEAISRSTIKNYWSEYFSEQSRGNSLCDFEYENVF